MKIAIDNIKDVSKLKGHDIIYVFNDESLDELLNTKLHCIRYDVIDEVDINLTDYDINCIKKAKINEDNWDKLPSVQEHKIGIIIPNYNYEELVNKCLSSIANQTYKNFEVIFVDDMSTDNSIKEAEKFKDKMDLKIIPLKQKRLNGGARNEGYLYLSKDVDYVMYIDSDDWLLNDMALELINRALNNNPDVLFIGLSKFKNNETKECYEPDYKDRYEAMQGWSGSCGKIIKKSLATRQECLYNEGTLMEDRNQHRKICIYMNTFELLKKPLYVWNNSNIKSTTTIRKKETWGTSAIRQYADTLQLYLEQEGKDYKTDLILKQAIEKQRIEVLSGKDSQW